MFSKANIKIQALSKVKSLAAYLNKRKVYSFDLLSGWSCPFANECLSKVVETPNGRRIKDGPNTLFRCFSASQEATFPSTYDKRKNNYEFMKEMVKQFGARETAEYITAKQPKDMGVCRVHVAGDFFSLRYFRAWCRVAKLNPDKLYYAYTKSLTYWISTGYIPSNLILTASFGGRLDNLIPEYKLRSVVVVNHPDEAKKLNLEIDHDDSHAADPTKKDNDFALLIHGIQPKDSKAAEAIKRLKKENITFSYGKKS